MTPKGIRVTKTETAQLHPQALRHAREEQRLSMRELCRRVTARMSQPEQQQALQMRLGRLEKGDQVTEMDRELLEALAVELAVGVGDLAEAPVWVWIRLAGGRPGIVELAMRFPCWTTPERAYAARDWLAHASEGRFTPFADAQLVPMRFHALAQDVLDANYPDLSELERHVLTAVDPGSDGSAVYLAGLAGLNAVLNDGFRDQSSVDEIVEDIDRHGQFGEISQLHTLALRRIRLAPPEYPEVADSWRAREERLNTILERKSELRRQERERVLSGEVLVR
jgi:transcriptional regulator with XRE-family HTH domain